MLENHPVHAAHAHSKMWRNFTLEKTIVEWLQVSRKLSQGDKSGNKNSYWMTHWNTHMKYLSENVTEILSYQLFCRLRPFWVKAPTAKDRETCQCKMHENTQFMATWLKALKVINTSNLEDLVSQITCSTFSLACMYTACSGCKGNTVPLTDAPDLMNTEVEWNKWQSVKEKRNIAIGQGNIKEKEVRLTQKVRIRGMLKELILPS